MSEKENSLAPDEIVIQDEQASSESVNEIKDTSEKAVEAYASTGMQMVQSKFSSGEVSASEAGKEAAHLIMTAESLQDTDENAKFRKEFKDTKKEELLTSAEKALHEEEARNIEAKQKKAEAFYVSYRPILEFDLDHLLVKNAPKRIKYVKVLNKDTGKKERVMAEDQPIDEPLPERKVHTYSERSYGIPLMVMMLIVLTIPYFLCTIVLSIFNMINYIFVAISRFSRPAFFICAGIASIAILGLFIYVVILCIEGAFNVDIIPDIPR